MKFTNKTYENIAYGLLVALFILVIIYCFKFKYNVIQNLNFRETTNQNSIKEGFGGAQRKLKNDDDIYTLIDRKLQGLIQELGGDSGKKEVKQILTKTKKISDLECAKYMMNMIEENKGIKSIALDKMLDDDTNENYLKCKNYTELSNSIKSIIESL